jgi:hypothetical protein
MKSGLALYMLLSFIGMAGFGFLAMNPQGDMHGCIAALTRGGECPAESDGLASLVFHAGVIKGFSMATASTGFLAVFLLFAILVSVFARRDGENIAALFLSVFSRRMQEARAFVAPLERRIQRWLSLRENSPAVL